MPAGRQLTILGVSLVLTLLLPWLLPGHSRVLAARSGALGGKTVYVPLVRNGAIDPAFGGSWRTGLQVQNLDSGQSASVQIRFHRPDGSLAATVPATLAPAASQTFFGDTLGVETGFDGAAVVVASVNVAVIVNQLAADAGMAGSFDGVAATGTRVFVPAFQIATNPDATSVQAGLAIQNAGTARSSYVTVRLSGTASGGAPVETTVLFEIPLEPGASLRVTPHDLRGRGVATSAPFVGAATVESDQPLAVVVSKSTRRLLMIDTGEATGTGTLYAPLVHGNNGGFESIVTVQNAGLGDTTATLRIFSSATGAQVATETRPIPRESSAFWLVNSLVRGTSFVGSATVEAGPGGALVGVVAQYNLAANKGASYNLFPGDAAAASVLAPLVQTANSGWNTGFQVQNVGTSAASVTVSAASSSGQAGAVPEAMRSIAPGKSETWFPITAPGAPFVGSALATGSPGSRLVGIVNQLNQQTGSADYFTTYEALGR